jgi:hypothetical protein
MPVSLTPHSGWTKTLTIEGSKFHLFLTWGQRCDLMTKQWVQVNTESNATTFNESGRRKAAWAAGILCDWEGVEKEGQPAVFSKGEAENLPGPVKDVIVEGILALVDGTDESPLPDTAGSAS